MASNADLNKANRAKKDEFYTQLTDIEKEMRHYEKHFENKTIFCNCDDPEYSHFWLYFQLNFFRLGLKKLVSTHYEADKPSYKMEIVRSEIEKDRCKKGQSVGQLGYIPDYVKTPLEGNGDFRSSECIEILKEADIVITNPPFSLFREFVAQLMAYGKKFIIIGNMNALHYKEIFPLIQENKLWLGTSIRNGDREFRVPDSYPITASGYRIGDNGEKYIRVKGVRWYTNIETEQRHENLILYKTYTPEEYPTYINYDAIDVGKVSDIPVDYYGVMGVPDSFIQEYNPEQFEIIGLGCGDMAKKIGIKKNHRGRTDLAYLVNGVPKCPYSRILIRRKVNPNEN